MKVNYWILNFYFTEYYFNSYFNTEIYFKECGGYVKYIFTTETFVNVLGELVNRTTDNCDTSEELIYGDRPVSGKTFYFNQCSFTNDILTG